jgi:prepilin-type processing-associated H-X9-DG protein
MRLKTALTKKDIIVILVCLIFLVINLGAISSGGRRRAKRTLCLTNLRQLTLAWTDYAVDNDGKLVNGDTGEYVYSGIHVNETPWVQKDWEPGTTLAEKEQAIRDGALFPYCGDIKLYKCPLRILVETRSYCVVDAMNCKGWDSYRVMLKTITAIHNPDDRAVFLDDAGNGGASLGGWTQYSIYSSDRWTWWDPPPIRHDKGTTFSFADGHTEYWKWKDRRTVEWGAKMMAFSPPQIDNPDLTRSQIASWGD